MIDFPDSPNVGDKFAPQGGAAVYEWDGVMWKVIDEGELYLPVAQFQGPIDVSGFSTYTFSNIPAAVQELELLWVDLDPSTNNEIGLRVQVGGVDQTTGYLSSGSAIGSNTDLTTNEDTTKFLLLPGSGTNPHQGRVKLRRFVPGSNKWVLELTGSRQNGAKTWNSSGSVDATGEVDGITLFCAAGTWIAGTIALRYEDPPAALPGDGGGSGEANTQSTPAAGDANLNMAKIGVDLPLKALVGGADIVLTNGANTVTITAASALLRNVDEDSAPSLGGDLNTDNFDIVFINSLAAEIGRAGIGPSDEDVAFYHSSNGVYDPTDGGILAYAGVLELHGTSLVAAGLKHGDSTGRSVYVSSDGILYGVEHEDTGWSVSVLDPNSYDLGTGTGAGTWVRLTGLSVNPSQDIALDEWVSHEVRLFVDNKTTNRSGDLEIAVTVNGVTPTAVDASKTVAPDFDGYLVMAVARKAAVSISTGDTLDVWARINNGSHSQFGLDLVGTPSNHNYVVTAGAVPGLTVSPESFRFAAMTVNNGTVPGGFVDAPVTSFTVDKLTARCDGGNCTVQVNVNGSPLAGYTLNLVNGVVSSATPAAQALADGDVVELVVSAATADVNVMATLRGMHTT